MFRIAIFIGIISISLFSSCSNGKSLAEFEKEIEEFYEKYSDNREDGIAFLTENKSKQGVVVTDSGLQYKVLSAVEGEKITQENTVSITYKGSDIEGAVFDEKENLKLEVSNLISGLKEGVQLMTVGSKYQFFIPYQLGYGKVGSRKVKPYSVTIFEVQIISIEL